jgi:acyl-CoA reductase-like NAD-dependent aldehyde dehydrogenase
VAYLEPIERDGRRGYRVLSPVDERELFTYEVTTAEEVRAAVERARVAQKRWGAMPVRERSRLMLRVLDVLLRRKDELIARMTAETGRPVLDTLMIEMFAACDALNYYSRRAPKVLADRSVGLHLLRTKKAKVVHKPLGVVGVISPWNGPFILSLNPTLQAVLAGNCVVLKPSEVTPDAGRMVGELFAEAGFPAHVVQVCLGDGETGAALVDSGVDKITFTGSQATGRKIGAACGRNLTPCQLELGGKDPMIVLDDADLDRAAGGAVFGGIMNTGQFCSGIERVYVQRSVAAEFTKKVAAVVGQLKLGKDYGPFIMKRQADIVEEHVREAVERGATVVVGGLREGNSYRPTVVTDVDHTMKLMKDETFGPVIPIVPFDTEEEGLRLANVCQYGLSGSVWSTDPNRAERVARQLETGSATINETSMIYGIFDLPFGGVKGSGMGQVNGAEALKAYTRAFPILSDRLHLKDEAVWFPYDDEKADGVKKALSWLWGTPLRRLL